MNKDLVWVAIFDVFITNTEKKCDKRVRMKIFFLIHKLHFISYFGHMRRIINTEDVP